MHHGRIPGRVVWVLAGLLGLSPPGQAACWMDSGWPNADHALVNGFLDQAVPEIHFLVPGDAVGNGMTIAPSAIVNSGIAAPDQIRFRHLLRLKSRAVAMQVDSTQALQCTSCSMGASIPLSRLSWSVDTGTSTGSAVPADGSFNNSVQTWITSQPGDDSTFNLRFDFMNDTIYPAGTYEGQFLTRGVPQ
ncbi:MAG: hypothetical protein KDI44_05400 [Thiothrix sp.]|nr:hypothetical protein [Thiothrix sp.]HPQ94472.1 hypothetical protein [Thiolinea sp.]